jgi:putative ABC transport system permease protein
MTIAIFGLIIFSITVMSMIVGIIGANIDEQIDEAAGGFDIFGFTLLNSPITDIDAQIAATAYGSKIERTVGIRMGPVSLKNVTSDGEDVSYQLLGVNDSFIDNNNFGIAEMSEEYEDEAEVWNALRENSSLIIIDASIKGVEFGPPPLFTSNLGATLNMTTADGILVEKKIVGILETSIFAGIFMYNTTIEQQFGVSDPNFFLFAIKDDENTEEMAKNLEKTFLRHGMQTTAVKTLVEEIIQTMNQFFGLFEAFMGLGLVIGIAGLGIITIRSVHERRQEIGMMRAIGFKRTMVLKSFLIETSFVAIIGIFIGTVLGIFIGYILWRDEFRSQGFEFFLNWQPIVAVALISLFVTLICIIPASRKASKVPPAEALRYKE